MLNKSIPISSLFFFFVCFVLLFCFVLIILFLFVAIFPDFSCGQFSWRHDVKIKEEKEDMFKWFPQSLFAHRYPLCFFVITIYVRNIKYWITLSKKHYEERKESNGRPYFFSVCFFFYIASLSSQRWGKNKSRTVEIDQSEKKMPSQPYLKRALVWFQWF